MLHKTIKKSECPHAGEIKITQTDKTACEICGEKENLRLCTSCGSVFCCESHQAHNREHFEKTKHPIIVPLPTGGSLSWTWCWVDQSYLE